MILRFGCFCSKATVSYCGLRIICWPFMVLFLYHVKQTKTFFIQGFYGFGCDLDRKHRLKIVRPWPSIEKSIKKLSILLHNPNRIFDSDRSLDWLWQTASSVMLVTGARKRLFMQHRQVERVLIIAWDGWKEWHPVFGRSKLHPGSLIMNVVFHCMVVSEIEQKGWKEIEG